MDPPKGPDADLLALMSFPCEEQKRPLMLELAVDPATEPFLITSSSDLMWVLAGSLRNDLIRVGVRSPQDRGGFYLDVVLAVESAGREWGWGNSFDWSLKGVRDAMAYLQSYGLDPLILTPPLGEDEAANPLFAGQESAPTQWLPPGVAVVVPKDRHYLGVYGRVGTGGYFLGLLHNPSRGLAILRMPPVPEGTFSS